MRPEALIVALALAGCAAGVRPEPREAFQGPRLTPNEQHHIVRPCEEHVLSPARVLLEVAVDAGGNPHEARVTVLGGTVRHAFANCARTRMLAQKYEPRGQAVTLGAEVDLRLGQFSNAGAATPSPPGY